MENPPKRKAIDFNMRAIRAQQFASQIVGTLTTVIPDGPDIEWHRIHNALVDAAYESNAIIVNLPPSHDALSSVVAQQRMITVMHKPLLAEVEEFTSAIKLRKLEQDIAAKKISCHAVIVLVFVATVIPFLIKYFFY